MCLRGREPRADRAALATIETRSRAALAARRRELERLSLSDDSRQPRRNARRDRSIRLGMSGRRGRLGDSPGETTQVRLLSGRLARMDAIVGALLIGRQVLEWRLFQAGQTTFTVGRLLAIAALLFAIFGLTRWARDWTVRQLIRRSGVRVGVAHAVASIVRYLLVFIGLIVLLETIGIDLSSLMVVAGALGVGIGLGLQGITNNFVSGLILLIERPDQGR